MDGHAPEGYTYLCPKCGGNIGYVSPSGMSVLCPICPWQGVSVTLTPLEEKLEDVAISLPLGSLILLTENEYKWIADREEQVDEPIIVEGKHNG